MEVTFNFPGKIVAVTGAANGIGLKVAKDFASSGASVVLLDRDEEGLRMAMKWFREHGFTVNGMEMDVADYEQVRRAFAQIDACYSRLDILVNAAGVSLQKPATEMKKEDWSRVMEVNLGGLFFCCCQAMQLMQKGQSGAIVNIASQLGLVGKKHRSAYTASKAAVINLTRTLALEWADFGVRVNAVAPGPVQTQMTRYLSEDSTLKEEMLSQIPLKRIGYPQDISPAVLFLASNNASFITGHTLVVDGGYTIQ